MENYECVIWPRVPHDLNGHPGQGRPNNTGSDRHVLGTLDASKSSLTVIALRIS